MHQHPRITHIIYKHFSLYLKVWNILQSRRYVQLYTSVNIYDSSLHIATDVQPQCHDCNLNAARGCLLNFAQNFSSFIAEEDPTRS